jgi:hypothetical protein
VDHAERWGKLKSQNGRIRGIVESARLAQSMARERIVNGDFDGARALLNLSDVLVQRCDANNDAFAGAIRDWRAALDGDADDGERG